MWRISWALSSSPPGISSLATPCLPWQGCWSMPCAFTGRGSRCCASCREHQQLQAFHGLIPLQPPAGLERGAVQGLGTLVSIHKENASFCDPAALSGLPHRGSGGPAPVCGSGMRDHALPRVCAVRPADNSPSRRHYTVPFGTSMHAPTLPLFQCTSFSEKKQEKPAEGTQIL